MLFELAISNVEKQSIKLKHDCVSIQSASKLYLLKNEFLVSLISVQGKLRMTSDPFYGITQPVEMPHILKSSSARASNG